MSLSRFTQPGLIFWIRRSGTESSNSSCRIAHLSSWGTTWLEPWSGSGPRSANSRPVTRIYARPRDGRVGTFAEFISINEADLTPKPKNLSMEEAASIPLVSLTAWQVLVEKANLQKGQKILIHAGSGGVGTFAIQLAKHLGATVATTTSAANIELVKSLGADVVVDYKREDFSKVLSGYDVVLNSLDKGTLEKSLSVLKPGGKLISISGPPDVAFAKEIGASWFLQQIMRLLSFGIRRKAKRHHINYSFLFMRASGEQLRQITSLIEAGIIRPVMDRIFPFEASTKLWLTPRRDGQRAKSWPKLSEAGVVFAWRQEASRRRKSVAHI